MHLQIRGIGNRYFVILCIMGSFAILSSTMSKNPVLNPFARSLGTPNDLLGLIAAASTIPGILISLPVASLSDIIGRRKVLLFAAFVFASAPFLYLLVGTWWQLALVRFYHGFATAVFVPVTEATVAEQFAKKRGERISLINSATGIGRTTAPILGGLILALTSNSYFTLYFAVGIAGITSFILAFLLLTERRNIETQNIPVQKVTDKMFKGWREITRTRNALLASFIHASQYYVFGAVEFFIVGYAIEAVSLDAFYAGLIVSAHVATVIIARPILGRISDKKGRRNPIILGSIISSLILLTIPFTVQFSFLLLLSVGYGISFAMVISSTSPLMSELAPAGMTGTYMGFLCTMMDIGQTLGPIVSGIILTIFNQKYIALFASLSFILLASSIIFMSRTGKSKTKG